MSTPGRFWTWNISLKSIKFTAKNQFWIIGLITKLYKTDWGSFFTFVLFRTVLYSNFPRKGLTEKHGVWRKGLVSLKGENGFTAENPFCVVVLVTWLYKADCGSFFIFELFRTFLDGSGLEGWENLIIRLQFRYMLRMTFEESRGLIPLHPLML